MTFKVPFLSIEKVSLSYIYGRVHMLHSYDMLHKFSYHVYADNFCVYINESLFEIIIYHSRSNILGQLPIK